MQAKSWILLKVLINHFHAGDEDSLLEGMNQEDQQMVLSQHLQSSDIAPAIISQREKFSKIHYSWLAPRVSSLPIDKASLFLSIFPEPGATKLKETLKNNVPSLNVTPSIQNFLFNLVAPLLKMDDVKPIEYLPESSLTPLAKLKKSELVDLIDFLGIYDLADEVKRIVDRNKLKQIYETLTPKKHDFLRECMHLREKLVTPKLNLDIWDGNHEKLNKILYQRGIVRLGYALSGQPPDFVWHIVHTLDSGRGSNLLKSCSKEQISGVTATVTLQVLNVIKFFKDKK
jgi:hypothetical protein